MDSTRLNAGVDNPSMLPFMASSVRFNVPYAARSFAPFLRLPAEIRHQIWEEVVLEPGMHFLRMQIEFVGLVNHLDPPLQLSHHSDPDSNDEGNGEKADGLPDVSKEKRPEVFAAATLMPHYPSRKAERSNYVALNRSLANLFVTCAESRSVAIRLTEKAKCLRLRDGLLVSLAKSTDVVCLEYLHPELYRSGCHLSMAIDCRQLVNIRRLAVPYCHRWETKNTIRRCPQCGRLHGSHRKTYPVHLYEFLARHLPNLEAFYFIDYLMLRRDPVESLQASTTTSPTPDSAEERTPRTDQEACLASLAAMTVKDEDTAAAANGMIPANGRDRSSLMDTTGKGHRQYKSAGRVFVEADQRGWNAKSSVFDTIDWVRKSFVHYAANSKLSNHKRPDEVEFGVLGCDWVDDRVTAPPKRPCLSTRKTQSKRQKVWRGGEDGQTRGAPGKPANSAGPSSQPLGADSQEPFVFGRNMYRSFDFRVEL